MSLTFNKSWIVDGTPTNATSATIGVLDATSGLQVVAAGTAMTNPSTGQYSYELSTALPEHAYTATIVVTYDGETYTSTETAPALLPVCPPAHHLNRAIAENAAGAMNVSSAAGSVTAHPLDKQILAADRQAAIEARRRGSPGFAVFRIGGDSPR